MDLCLKQLPWWAFLLEKVTASYSVWQDSKRPEWHYYKVRRSWSVCEQAERGGEGSRAGRGEDSEGCLEREKEDWRESGWDAIVDWHPRIVASGEVPMLKNQKCIFKTMTPSSQCCHLHWCATQKLLYFPSCFGKKSAVYNRFGLTVSSRMKERGRIRCGAKGWWKNKIVLEASSG